MAASASPPALFLGALSARSAPNGGITSTPRLFVVPATPSRMRLRTPPRRSSVVAFARRKKSSPATSRTKPYKEKTSTQTDDRDDDIGEDAFEALFSQLEEDLKNDNLSADDLEGNDIDEDAFEALFSQLEADLKNDDLSDSDTEAGGRITEDLVKLEQELENTLGGEDADESPGASSLNSGDEADEEAPPKLRSWQLRRLARAIKVGRRKTSIKSLAGELGLDRAIVLELLRNPPTTLLLLSASLPDEVAQVPPEPEHKPMELPRIKAESKPETGVPVHVTQTRWSMQKRLKKAHIETLERVYERTKRPTNSMISSIVHVTNLPTKRVVQWFEEKRLEDGVPKQRVPFRRSTPEAISTK